MPTDPAPEKVAALAAALGNTYDDGEEGWRLVRMSEDGGVVPSRLPEAFIEAILAALNAAGYDVARIEKGERTRRERDALAAVVQRAARRNREAFAADGIAAADRVWAVGVAAVFNSWQDAEVALEAAPEARAALAASDEAVRP